MTEYLRTKSDQIIYIPTIDERGYVRRRSGSPATLYCSACDGLTEHRNTKRLKEEHELWKCTLCDYVRVWG